MTTDDKTYADASADVQAIHAILDELVWQRKYQNISVRQMAEKLGVSVYTVTTFESEMSDPKLSLIMRYARVVGFKVEVLLSPRDTE